LFAEVLGLPRVGIDDGFFDLGGHSLTATRLVARIRTELGVDIPIRAVFDAPSVAGLAHWLVTHCDGRVRAALTARQRPARMPLSFAQTRLWFLHKFEGPSATYNIAWALRLAGGLDSAALTSAIGDVVARHESLRTVFAEADGTPWQQVLAAGAVEVPVTLTEIGDAGQVGAAITRAARYRFDLATHVPLRAELLRVSAIEHVLVLVVHHVAGDGASEAPLAQDLASAYTARCAGRAPDWAPLAVSYADYTLWQHELLGDQHDPDSVLSHQLAYWRDELAGAPEQIALPGDRPRPPQQSFRGETLAFSIDARLRQRIEHHTRDTGTTTSMVLQTALAVLLHKLGAGDDLTIGGPIAGRTDEALTELIGFFVNTWVLRVDTSGNPRFSELLGQVRGKALAAYDNQDVPFERLVELLNPARSTAYHPLFQVAFALQNNPLPTLDFPGLSVDALPASTGTAKFDLFITVLDLPPVSGHPQPWPGFIEYATDLFDRDSIDKFAACYLRILDAITADPHRRIDLIEIIDATERTHVLTEWNNTTTTLPEATVSELFAAQVARTPDAAAVEDDATTLTYRELDARANRLADRLKTYGARPEAIIAVALPRSAQLITALVAIIKTGAAYLPIDANYPSQRSTHILTDAAPRLLISDTATAATLPATTIPHLILDTLDAQPPAGTIGAQTTNGEHDRARADNLAYVMYTSGSTGQPKPVMVTHRGVANFINRAAETLTMAGLRVMASTSIAFDVSVLEIFTPLSCGGCLEIEPDALVLGRENAWSSEIISTVPSVFAEVLKGVTQPVAPQRRRTRTVVLIGEAVPRGLIHHAQNKLPGLVIVNGYGPTEAAVCATTYSIPAASGCGGTSVPIGCPLGNVQVFVLDAGGCVRCRWGWPGSCISPGRAWRGGIGVGRG
jgi:non-ribosomal peptide synthetase component F/acyl carrier protein